VFIPGPFEAPVRGREAIRVYWRDVPLEQAEIAFRHGEIFVAGPWFATEYKCTFRRRRTGEAVTVKGALFCETVEGRLSEMRMYWERSVRRS
jgi:ketosteroid isomerase-like protein